VAASNIAKMLCGHLTRGVLDSELLFFMSLPTLLRCWTAFADLPASRSESFYLTLTVSAEGQTVGTWQKFCRRKV
jgi:hypothetical protein